jgi:hypothetical protein
MCNSKLEIYYTCKTFKEEFYYDLASIYIEYFCAKEEFQRLVDPYAFFMRIQIKLFHVRFRSGFRGSEFRTCFA